MENILSGINWYSIIVTIVLVVIGFLASYLKTRGKITGRLAEFIAKAEETYKSTTGKGEQKHSLVIEWAYNLVPTPLKPFITRDLIANLLDNVFEQVKEYSELQLDKLADKIIPDEDDLGAEDA